MDRWLEVTGAGHEAELSQVWHANRRYLIGVAFRMLGNFADAEDVVQEAFTRLLRADLAEITDVRGWLVVVVTRLCVNQLNSAHHRRETAGELAEQGQLAERSDLADPADRVTLDDSIRLALLVLLERLAPAERAAFVLHDVFQMSFDTIASILGRSPAASRQLASRARRRLQSATTTHSFDVDLGVQRRVAERFIEACAGGSLAALMDQLAQDVSGRSDRGEFAPEKTAHGPLTVARVLLTLFGRDPTMTMLPIPINGQPGILAFRGRQLYAILILTTRGPLITEVHAISDPHKLAHVSTFIGAQSPPTNRPPSR